MASAPNEKDLYPEPSNPHTKQAPPTATTFQNNKTSSKLFHKEKARHSKNKAKYETDAVLPTMIRSPTIPEGEMFTGDSAMASNPSLRATAAYGNTRVMSPTDLPVEIQSRLSTPVQAGRVNGPMVTGGLRRDSSLIPIDQKMPGAD